METQKFDPYDMLIATHYNCNQLIKGHNQHDELLRDLTEQHAKLISVLKMQRQMIDNLQLQVNNLRNFMDETK